MVENTAVEKRLFLSWCHRDKKAKKKLVKLLEPHLKTLRGVNVEWWEDSDIRIGENWRLTILANLEKCDYGVLLLSPEFLASKFILDEELPWFVGEHAAKGALPVGLEPVLLDGSRELAGVDRHQVFTDNQGRFFTETSGKARKRFAADLATAIHKRIMSEPDEAATGDDVRTPVNGNGQKPTGKTKQQ